MRVTVCELTNDPARLESDWERLCAHVGEHGSHLVLLPEMPFSEWLASRPTLVPDDWAAAVEAHSGWIARLQELGASTVVSTRPVIEDGNHYNQGYVWTAEGHVARAVHKKRYLPDEPGFWEASWYSPGDTEFADHDVETEGDPGGEHGLGDGRGGESGDDGDGAVQDGAVKLGFAICTEIWFQQHARDYGKRGVQLLVCPRATLRPSVDKWIAGGRAAAVVSGAFCLSSNFTGSASTNGNLGDWGGAGWIIEPEEGNVLGVTTREAPFLTLEIDLGVADTAKTTYPRYVLD